MNLKELFTKCLMFLAIGLLGHLAASCTDTEETDSSKFALYYYGVTDIGPSMNFDLKEPSYIGSAPYDFSITNVTLNGENCSSESFTIDGTTGVIHIKNTSNLATGTYSLSVACYSNGKYYEFKNAVQVNMLLAVPQGITVTPEEVVVKLDEENWIESSAQVTTEEGTHVSVTGYAIAEDDSKEYLEYFSISTSGKITINSKHKDKLIAGEKYILSLKLTTRAGEHLYPDAVTFKVVSKPCNLLYTPNSVQVEQNAKHESSEMSILGSKEDLTFKIKSVTPETNVFEINSTTGKISLKENNGLEVSSTPYSINITVSNAYGETDFSDAYRVQIVDYIMPIDPATFEYEPAEIYQGAELVKEHEDNLIGSAITFSFNENNKTDIQEEINKKRISIDHATGAISISNDNTLEAGIHDINIKATNVKSEGFATFKLTIKRNPNSFKFVSYGTNLENSMEVGDKTSNLYTNATKEENHNLFRYINRGNIPADNLTIRDSDLPTDSDIKFEIVQKYPDGKFSKTQINPNTGEITFNGENPFGTTYDGGILLIKVTVSGHNAPSIIKNIPLFFSTPKITSKEHTIIYTPFVIKANPRTGKCSQTKCEVIQWKSQNLKAYLDTKDMAIDYRSDYAYYNFDDNSNHVSGKIADNQKLLIYQVWSNYQSGINYGAKTPMSYYLENEKLSSKVGYIEPSTFQIKINPNKWIGSDGEYANGAVFAQTRARLDGNTEKLDDTGDDQTIPVFSSIIWLDENF